MNRRINAMKAFRQILPVLAKDVIAEVEKGHKARPNYSSNFLGFSPCKEMVNSGEYHSSVISQELLSFMAINDLGTMMTLKINDILFNDKKEYRIYFGNGTKAWHIYKMTSDFKHPLPLPLV